MCPVSSEHVFPRNRGEEWGGFPGNVNFTGVRAGGDLAGKSPASSFHREGNTGLPIHQAQA